MIKITSLRYPSSLSPQPSSLHPLSMHSQLELTPHGVVICHDTATRELAPFHESEAAGLIRIAGQKLSPEVDDSVLYWKGFTEHFIRALCQTASENESELQIDPPAADELSDIILNAPPIRGAEYLSLDVLRALWQ